MKVQWRKNVLMLVGMGYTLMTLVFVVLLFEEGMTVSDAYDVIDGPVMALIGGSLTVANNLIDGDSPANNHPENPQDPSKDRK